MPVSPGKKWSSWVENTTSFSVIMRILALITARGGSKRIPGKNIRPLGEKPLIIWSINVAKDIPGIVDILVSTDDKNILEVAKNAGALVP